MFRGGALGDGYGGEENQLTKEGGVNQPFLRTLLSDVCTKRLKVRVRSGGVILKSGKIR